MAEIYKIGDWDIIGLLTANLRKELDRAAKTSVRRLGIKAEAIAKLHIQNQDLPWEPLNPAYKASKARRGLSENMLMATTSYFQAITSWHEGLRSLAGVKRTAQGQNGEDLGVIARTLEYGSEAKNIKSRPLWQPTLVETAKWHEKNNQAAFIFKDNIRKKYGIAAQ